MMKYPENDHVSHFCFEFAKNVLLPRPIHQPGHIHFVTGLKFDLNGVSASKSGLNYIFGFVEGHCTVKKSENCVLSMLDHVINLPAEEKGASVVILLTADNFSWKNKNRFVLWYLCYLVLIRRKKKVKLRIPIIGHTKNPADGSFVSVKRRLRERDVIVSEKYDAGN